MSLEPVAQRIIVESDVVNPNHNFSNLNEIENILNSIFNAFLVDKPRCDSPNIIIGTEKRWTSDYPLTEGAKKIRVIKREITPSCKFSQLSSVVDKLSTVMDKMLAYLGGKPKMVYERKGEVLMTVQGQTQNVINDGGLTMVELMRLSDDKELVCKLQVQVYKEGAHVQAASKHLNDLKKLLS